MPPTLPDEEEFVRFSKGGLAIREVPGRKNKPWPHKPDRRIEALTDGWIAPSLLQQATFLYLYARNEDRLYPPGHGSGGQMVWNFMADVPLLGPKMAYAKWVEKYR